MNQRGSFALIMAALILTAGYNAQGQTFTNYLWNNSSTIYANASSWTNGVAPSGDQTARSNNIIQFSNFGANNNTVSLSASNTVGTILFSPSANLYTFESTTSTVRLSTMIGITNNSTTTQTFNLLVDTKVDNTWYQAAGGSMIFNTNVGLASVASSTARTLTLTGGGTFDFKAGMTGAATNTGAGGKLVVNNSGGSVNLRASNSLSEMTLTAGTLNINNNNALGTGVLTLTGGAMIDNTSGSAVVNTGNNALTWNNTTALNFGSATNSAANNLNLGTGTVTLTGSRRVDLLGTGTKLTIGDVLNNGLTFTANGAGNTLEMKGLSLSTNSTSGTVTLDGTANFNITGAIVNGTAPGSGLSVTNTGTNNFSGNNTYTGTTSFQSCRTIISGDNSAAVGNVKIATATTFVRLDNTNAISRNSSLLGDGSAATLDFRVAGDFTFNSFGTGDSSSVYAGQSMVFTNSSGSQKTVTFTNANNYITSLAAASRGLVNNSSNMNLDFDGNVTIGGATNGTTSFAGAGNFNVDGNLIMSSGATGLRNLQKTGAGTLTLRGTNNNYTGPTLVDAGTLEVGTAGVLPSASSITVTSGATLRFNKSSDGISVGPLAVAGTLEQNLITITSSGAVNLTGSTLKVNGTPILASYTLVSGAPLTGTPPNLNPLISGYALRISGNNLLLEKVVTDAYALYLSNNNMPAGTAFNAIIDDVTVGLKYAFASANGTPQNNGEAAVPVMSGNQLTYTFDVKDDSALTVTYQTSTDLVTWTTARAVSAGTGAAPTGFLKKQVQVTGSDRLFVRLNVTR